VYARYVEVFTERLPERSTVLDAPAVQGGVVVELEVEAQVDRRRKASMRLASICEVEGRQSMSACRTLGAVMGQARRESGRADADGIGQFARPARPTIPGSALRHLGHVDHHGQLLL
jgi:hypothetical protein